MTHLVLVGMSVREVDARDRLTAVAARHDGTVVGDSMLHLQGTGLTEGEIGWTILPGSGGRGYATEAARAHRLAAPQNQQLHCQHPPKPWTAT